MIITIIIITIKEDGNVKETKRKRKKTQTQTKLSWATKVNNEKASKQ